MKSPTPDQIRRVREDAGLTQTEAAALIHSSMRAWQNWEAGSRRMPPSSWELFIIKVAAAVAAEIRSAGPRK